MRTRSRSVALVVAAVVVLVALVAYAAPRLTSTNTNHIELSGCDGGVTASVPAGDYLVAVHNESVTLCVADAGCLTGGQYLPQNLAARLTFGVKTFVGADTPDTISCNSPTQDGGLSLTLIAPGT
jgi:hypothetical protein